MVRKEILQARAIPRDTLLQKVNNQKNGKKITFKYNYHPVLCNVRKILEEMHMTEAVARSCSVKKVFLKISQNSQENTCARVSDCGTGVFL